MSVQLIQHYSLLFWSRKEARLRLIKLLRLTIFGFLKFKHEKILAFVILSIFFFLIYIIQITVRKSRKAEGNIQEEKDMACYVPFNNRNLDISFFVFRPTVVYVDDLVEALKQFSLYTESLGCVHSSIFRSIHGNMIIWYGAWMKRSDENKQLLSAALLSVLTNVASMAILMDHSFFEAYAGESRDGSPAAKFFTGDIVSLSSATLSANDPNENNVSYACLAIFKDRFHKMDGARAGVCFKSQSMPRIVGLFVWKSLQFCYTFILTSDYRKTVLPYVDGFALDIKYDVFRVVYVSGDNVLSFQFYPEHRMLENEIDNNEAYPVVQDFKER